MKPNGPIALGVALALTATETLPRKEVFDNPHVTHNESNSTEIERAGMTSSLGAYFAIPDRHNWREGERSFVEDLERYLSNA
jgi:hypothetical protein